MKITFGNLLFTALVFILPSCNNQIYSVKESNRQQISISDEINSNHDFTHLIEPYKQRMDGELDRILAYNPVDLHNKGLNFPLGNLVTDLMLEEANKIYSVTHPDDKIDVCLMNKGGLRRSFSPGNLTVRSMYELMPFENEAVVVTMTGEKFLEMVEFLRRSDRGHPVAGFSFNKFNEDMNILLGEKPFNVHNTYRVLTNDYLQKGGDYMTFFKDPIKVEFLNIRLREMYINYFDKIDTVRVNTNPRYIEN